MFRALACTQVLDSDKSGGLESAEFCAAIKKLVCVESERDLEREEK